jgi:hypothetical protein
MVQSIILCVASYHIPGHTLDYFSVKLRRFSARTKACRMEAESGDKGAKQIECLIHTTY